MVFRCDIFQLVYNRHNCGSHTHFATPASAIIARVSYGVNKSPGPKSCRFPGMTASESVQGQAPKHLHRHDDRPRQLGDIFF